MKRSKNSLIAFSLGMVHIAVALQHIYAVWISPFIIMALILFVSYQKPRWFQRYLHIKEPEGLWALNVVSFLLLLVYLFPLSWLEPIIVLGCVSLLEYGRYKWKSNHLTWEDRLGTRETTIKQTDQVLLDLRRERHDYVKHLSSLQYMLEQGHHQEAIQYMEDLVGEFEQLSTSVSGEKSAVAGVLHSYHREAKDRKIQLRYEFEVPASKLPLPQEEIVVLLGNALSNALEAAQQFQESVGEEGQVIAKLQKKSAFYILTIRNDTLPVPNWVLDRLYHIPATTTKAETGERGYGATSIQSIVQKRHGHLDFTYKQNHFTLKIKLPSIQIE
ncbi:MULTISPECIES: sensor histidine kinase [Pontibacillus]|uniref:GHKL domain-containing protein n=1 Tax=Pontibacillus chungwhensis TaxID=265426 RepID=A0ABY8UWW5_9BACI|nr:GHKL domain-containing protein [Pontibacillus chungwhensis]MCD5325761.1 GHKL domain-containing protein [Pontibacillus sp. HN14]WIF98002.1 GHKL domain-containing protein [Pontibacillus chungwhensis]